MASERTVTIRRTDPAYDAILKTWAVASATIDGVELGGLGRKNLQACLDRVWSDVLKPLVKSEAEHGNK